MRPLAELTVAQPPSDIPARSRWADGVVLVLAVATPLIAYFGNLGFAVAAALAGLLLAPVAPWRRAPWLLFAVLAAGALWAAASSGWSPFHPPATHRLKDLAQNTAIKLPLQLVTYGALAAGVARVSAAGADRAATWGGYLLTAVAALLLLEALDHGSLYQLLRDAAHQHQARPDLAVRDLGRSSFVLALLFWPASLALARRGLSWAGIVIFVCTFAAAFVLHIDSPMVALVLTVPVFLAVRAWGRIGVVLTAVGVLAYVLFAPSVVALAAPLLNGHAMTQTVGKASWAARLDVWTFVDRLIRQKPLLGWGLDASRAWPGVIPLHPHDGALQVWLELGVPGAALAAAAWALVFAGVARLAARDRGVGAAACATACAYAIIGALSFGVWQEWWLALAAVAAVWVALLDRGEALAPHGDLPALQPA